MKRLGAFLVLSVLLNSVFGQEVVRTYYDENDSVLKEEFYVLSKSNPILDGPYVSYFDISTKRNAMLVPLLMTDDPKTVKNAIFFRKNPKKYSKIAAPFFKISHFPGVPPGNGIFGLFLGSFMTRTLTPILGSFLGHFSFI